MPRKSNPIGSLLSAGSVSASKRRGAIADKARAGVNYLRQTRNVPADPSTSTGRAKLTAMYDVERGKRALKKGK